MILFISNSGESLPIAARMIKEGCECKVYVHHPDYQDNYAGLVPKVSLARLKSTVAAAERVIFDITRINTGRREDRALLRLFGADASAATVFGPVADVIRQRGTPVIGASAWTETLEFARDFGEVIARKCGFKTPASRTFRDVGHARQFLKTHSERLWVLKPHNNADLDLTYVEKFAGELAAKFNSHLAPRIKGRFSLQEKIAGTEISSEGWFDGRSWRHFNHTLEDKRLGSGDTGPAIGSQSNTVWRADGFRFATQFARLTPYLKTAGYVGPVDVNCILRGRQAYFLEWTPRFGYDAIYNFLSLLDGPIHKFFTSGFAGKFAGGFACSQRVSIPPYPYAEAGLLKQFAKNVPIENTLDTFWGLDIRQGPGKKIRCAGADGILGVVAVPAGRIAAGHEQVLSQIKRLRVGADVQYRIDAADSAEGRYREFKNA